MANPKHLDWLLQGVPSWNRRRLERDFEPDLSGTDIYSEFGRANKLSTGRQLPLSHINLDGANLDDCRLNARTGAAGANLRHATLMRATLRRAQLRNSRLNSACLIGAQLQGADLTSATLRGAELNAANLAEAGLFGADLTDADLSLAYLSKANLAHGVLKGARLVSTNLIDADLTASRPWGARLFAGEPSSARVRTRRLQISSVTSLLNRLRAGQNSRTDTVLYFRGEHDNIWELRPSVMRHEEPGAFALVAYESDMLVNLITSRPEDFSNAQSALDEWVLAQHHGLRTRLLDITRNPLVGLFAACEVLEGVGRLHVFSVPRELIKPFSSDTISVLANFAKLPRSAQNLLLGWTGEDRAKRDPTGALRYYYKDAMRRLYHLIWQEKPHFEERINPRDFYRVLVVEPRQSFKRIRAQSGAFLLSAFHERLETNEVRKWNTRIPIYRHSILEIPAQSKQRILDELRLLNVTREALFPGLDEAAEAVIQRHTK